MQRSERVKQPFVSTVQARMRWLGVAGQCKGAAVVAMGEVADAKDSEEADIQRDQAGQR